jgi:uncharacterized secreted protein with C-terminal beta-propeller domain
MSAPTKSKSLASLSVLPSSVQYLNDTEGNPLYVVLPYADFQALGATVKEKKDNYVPHEVAQRVLVENCSPAQSWREFLCKTTSEVAKKMGISESEYIQLEALPKLKGRSLREKVAGALEISPEQLKF